MAAFIILLICCGALLFIYYKYESTVCSLKQQCMLMSKQNKILKEKFSSANKKINNLKIKFYEPSAEYGISNGNIPLRIAPLSNSITIRIIPKDEKLLILRYCEYNNTIWYQISIDDQENINSIGWLEENALTLMNFNDSSEFSQETTA